MKTLVIALLFSCVSAFADSQKIINCPGGVSVFTSESVRDGSSVTIEFPFYGESMREPGTLTVWENGNLIARSATAEVTANSYNGYYVIRYHYRHVDSGFTCRAIAPAI